MGERKDTVIKKGSQGSNVVIIWVERTQWFEVFE